MQRLRPGVYYDAGQEALHISTEELCEALHLAHTRENAELVEREAIALLKLENPDIITATIEHREDRP